MGRRVTRQSSGARSSTHRKKTAGVSPRLVMTSASVLSRSTRAYAKTVSTVADPGTDKC